MKPLLTLLLIGFFLGPPLSSVAQQNACNWEVYFSPHGGCAEAIIRELNKAKSTILVQAYSFTSAPITKALLNAHKGGRHRGRWF